jgi:hypothetical protein
MCLFFHFSFFHAWLYVQCFARSIKHIGSRKTERIKYASMKLDPDKQLGNHKRLDEIFDDQH